MADTKTVKSSEIQVGDVVLNYGMRIRIDAIREYADPMPVYACDGTVLNLDEVKADGIVPMSWLCTDKWVERQGWVIDRRDRWVVQGNDLARWVIEA
jgi:hypothetical protein